MPLVNSNAQSSSWLFSTLDLLRRDKKAAENIAGEENPIDNLINSENTMLQEEATSLASQSHNAVTKHEHDSVVLNNPLPDKLPTVLSLSKEDFYLSVNDEKVRLLCGLLTEEGYITCQPCDIILTSELINHVTDYLTRYKDNEEKITAFVRLLLKPSGEYGANQGEKISYSRQQAVITDWLQYAIFGKSMDNWLLAQIEKYQTQQKAFILTAKFTDKLHQIIAGGIPSDSWSLMQTEQTKSSENFLLRHEDLKNDHHNQIELTLPYARLDDYYQQQLLNRIMPTLMLQPKKPDEQQRLQKMAINQPEWGYLHAGTALLSESGADFNSMNLNEIIDIGIWLEMMLAEKKVPAEYVQYFKLPAMIHDRLNKEHTATTTREMTDVYHNYFDYLTQYGQNNPFIRLVTLSQNWKSRPELARQQLKAHDVEESWLDNYLYHNREVDYPNKQGKMTSLPNINQVFAEQNQQIARFTEQTEKILLPLTFNSIRQSEQKFIEQADIQLVKARFDATSSLYSVPLPPSARQGMRDSDGLVTRVPESIDLLKCMFDGETRMYALTLEQDIGRYGLQRVDFNKGKILDLFPNDGLARYDNDYKLKIETISPLKAENDKPDILFAKLAKRHGEKLCQKLRDEGYEKTTRQKMEEFFLSLIPFYTCITEAQKGNTNREIETGLFDILSFVPFAGKSAQVTRRFGIAASEAAIDALRIALRHATIAEALKEGGKQLIKFGLPHIMKSVPRKAYFDVGVAFIRSADPGFELLATSGLKGLNNLKNAAINVKQKISGLTPLVEALDKQAKALSIAPVESFNTERAFRSDLRKVVQVANIGQERGKDIWVQVDPTTGALFGRKYLRDAAGNLELAPVLIRERLYLLKTQGMGGKGANAAAKNLSSQSDTVSTQLEKISLKQLDRLLVNRQANTIIDLSKKDLSNMKLSHCFNQNIDSAFVNLSGSNLTKSKLIKANLIRIQLNGANLTEVNLTNTNLYAADLSEANLTNAKLCAADLSEANLTKAKLLTANLIDADLTKANLLVAKLSKSKLTNANLSAANFSNSEMIDADLSGAKLNDAKILHANMHGANLAGADLTKANLTGTNIMNGNLSSANLLAANLTGAELQNANLLEANLTQVNLTNANLFVANLAGAKMIEANCLDASLVSADLRGANLTNSDLTNTDLEGANLTDANLTKVNLNEANLTEANLTNANLQLANLTDANLINVNLTGTNLAGTDFSGALLRRINFRDANLAGVDIIAVDFSGALLNSTLTINTFIEWNNATLDLILNHFHNLEGSLLTSIDSIDDRYRELKTKLALQLIHSLDRPGINLLQVRLPLIEVLGRPLFINNQEINHFINKLIENCLTDSSLGLLNNFKSHPQLIKPFFNYFAQHPHLLASVHVNSSFIQTIIATRMAGINVVENSAINELYEKYLKLPEIQQQLQHPEIKYTFGDSEGNANWADKHAMNYLLLSPKKPGRVLLVAENVFINMLHPDLNTRWDHIVLFQDGNCLSPTEYNLSRCYKEDFPLFAASFINSENQTTFNKLIEVLDLNDQYKQFFLEAIQSNAYSTKLIDSSAQQELTKIFSRLLDFQQGYILKKQNYDQILNLYNLTASTDREKAEHLFALSAVFTHYSSSAIFGTEPESPLMLRYYACALMEKAHNLDQTLIGQDRFNDWKNRLLGTENIFTCTAVLSNMMTKYASEHCNYVLQKIQPLAWR